MPTFLSDLAALEVGPWGLKGDALVRTAKAGLPIAPGFLLPAHEKADLSTALNQLQQQTGHTFAAQDKGFFLYVRQLPFDLRPGRRETAKYLGLHPSHLASDAAEICTRKAAIGAWSQLSALTGKDLPTLDDWLEDQGLDPLEASPQTAQVLRYLQEIEDLGAQTLSIEPLAQLTHMIAALRGMSLTCLSWWRSCPPMT